MLKYIMSLKTWKISLFFFLPVIIPVFLEFFEIFNSLKLLNSIIFILVFFMLLWHYSVGTFLFKISSIKYKLLNLKFFIFNTFFAAGSLILFLIIIVYNDFNFMVIYEPKINNNLFFSFISKYYLFAYGYIVYTISKLINTLEKNKRVSIFDFFIFDFMFIWVLPFGIWMIHPRLLNIYKKV